MVKTVIPQSIQKIIDEFVWFNFRPFTYKQLSERLDIDPNTLVQRINRNPDYFNLTGEKPKIIEVKKNINEIYFYRDENKCRICQKTFDPADLSIRYKDPNLKEKERDDWENVITTCSNCKDVDLVKKLNPVKKLKPPSLGNFIWEYKEIEVREINRKINPYIELFNPNLDKSAYKHEYEYYFEFSEDGNREWFYVSDDENKKCDKLADILNFFGNQGWEMIKMKEYLDEETNETEGYHCIFKRKMVLGENLND